MIKRLKERLSRWYWYWFGDQYEEFCTGEDQDQIDALGFIRRGPDSRNH